MKAIKSTKFLILSLLILLIANILFFFLFILKSKSEKTKINYTTIPTQLKKIKREQFLNYPAPEIEMNDTAGKLIKLNDHVGDIIVLRFSRFHPQDFPYLLYLDHLYNRYAKEGLHLFLIKLLEKRKINYPDWLISSSAPIIEDDGYIAAILQASLNDTIIIGRDFRIKFKHNNVSDEIIYNQIIRYLFEKKNFSDKPTKTELSSLFKKINYINVQNGKIENLGKTREGKRSLITLFIALCSTCKKNRRISQMKDVAQTTNMNENNIVLLFGKGNDINEIQNFSKKNNLFDYMTIGKIQGLEDALMDDYYRLFRFDINPRTIILDKNNKTTFLEEAKHRGSIETDFIKKILQ